MSNKWNWWLAVVLFWVIQAQAAPVVKPVVTVTNDAETVAALAALPAEEQATIKALKFYGAEPAPMRSRGCTYIKGAIQVINNSANNVVEGKLEVEMRLLCQDRDKKWGVIICTSKIDLAKKGQQSLNLNFYDYNSKLSKLNGEAGNDRPKPPRDTYTCVRYLGIKIYEVPGKSLASVPKDWWKDAELVK